MPTKAFFIDMLVKDIPLDRAVLDLVDNCIDGAKRLHREDNSNLSNLSDLKVDIRMDENRFEIVDNCGGFDVKTAQDYAFRFGKPAEANDTDYSIGQFGVGMKRALFKFGKYFEVHSTTRTQKWSMKVDVLQWESSKEWVFNFEEISENHAHDESARGTRIVVKKLRSEVASRFSDPQFQNRLSESIRSHQRQFLRRGLNVVFQGAHLVNTDLRILSGDKFRPVVEIIPYEEDTNNPINVRIVAGVGHPSPSEAGWYIVCNGRVILSADRTEETGWNSIQRGENGIPKYHNDFARFRGVVFFECRSSGKLPWNTTKTGIDSSSAIWQAVFLRMRNHTRTVIDFLKMLSNDVEEYGGQNHSPLHLALKNNTKAYEVEELTTLGSFSWDELPKTPGPKYTRIQYSRQEEMIEELKTALGVNSAKAVGEATFEMIYRQQVENGE